MDWLHRVVDRPGRALAWFGGIVTLLMMAHISADVIAREVFESPINGTLEITASFYMVALVFLPLAHVTLGEGHIVVELFTRNLTAPALRRLDGWIALLGLAYVGLMAVSGFEEALKRTRIRDTLETAGATFQVWPSRWLLPLGVGLMGLALLWLAIVNLQGNRRPGNGTP
jgi:TRAP-type C4-dicarboxylate transport system permease small subunit